MNFSSAWGVALPVPSWVISLGLTGLVAVMVLQDVLARVLLKPMQGLSILPAARAVHKLGRLSLKQQQILLDAMSDQARPVDIILVDASMSHPAGFSPFGLASRETVVVLSGSSASITEAYSLIKKVSQLYSRRHFRILVNKVRGVNEAEAIHGNISRLTRSRGLARLEYVGFVPFDEHLSHASRLCQPVVALFPDAPATKAYRTIASDLLEWPLPDDETGGLEQFVQQLLHLSQHIDPIAIYA